MKKSRSIQLTLVAALGMAARAQQSPAPSAPAAPQSCEERRNAAQMAGVSFHETCGHSTSGAHSVARGGFGSTASAHTGGG